MRRIAAVLLCWVVAAAAAGAQESRPLRIIAFGGHPDDCDIKAGGTAARWAAAGHKVKFVAVTNGDAGHQGQGGGALARRRMAEAREAARRIGIEYEVLDNHDAELLPTLAVRHQVIRRIRDWQADLVITHRTNDYHPDHRYTGTAVQDAAYMVVVPNVAPDTPPLRRNPVFAYFSDPFERPQPFRPDVVVAIDEVAEKKLAMLDAHVSQFYEWMPWVDGTLDAVPAPGPERRKWLAGQWLAPVPEAWRAALARWYGDR
ncbi:MAG TPA: PIG-L deacetylase family protein, partial [Vicinamibacteria bacterium]|nr:PIG-L deacetylase family protein [Vicinamibacteria bacterium]